MTPPVQDHGDVFPVFLNFDWLFLSHGALGDVADPVQSPVDLRALIGASAAATAVITGTTPAAGIAPQPYITMELTRSGVAAAENIVGFELRPGITV